MLSKKDILRICEIQQADVDPRIIPSCFELSDPREERCFKKGKPKCMFSNACAIFMAELFEIVVNGNEVTIELLSRITEEWEKYENKKLDEKKVQILEEKILKTIHSTNIEASEEVQEMIPSSIITGKVSTKVKEVSKEVVKNLSKEESLEPRSKRGTAIYYAEEFWLKEGGSEEDCIKYVEERVGKKSGGMAVGTIKHLGLYPYRLVEYEVGKFRLIEIGWM